MTVDEEASTARVEAFRAELRDDAPWVATVTPRLTWSVASGTPGWIQAWAEVRSAGEVVRIDGADSVLVPWPLSPLSPGEQTTVSVRVCSTEGAMTPWSEPLELTAVAGVEWVARPIALPEPDAVARPGRFRRAFDVDRPVRRALLHYTALGVVEMAVNGSAVDDTVLAPGWTSYRQRLTFETADVTALLSTGENLISARLGGGWWTEEYHVLTVPKRHYGAQPRLMAQLEIVYQDGGRDIVATDAGWAATPDPALTASGIYAGERFDARMFDDAWTQPGFDASAWPAASEAAEDLPVPTPRMSPPVRRIETRAVESVAQAPSGGVLLDFGQNLVGRLRIRVRGERGTVLSIRHAEVLDEGDLALRPLRRAAAADEYVLSGDSEETWEPRFTFHGFRYARIEGWPGDFDPADVEAVILHTDMPRTGWFDSSNTLLNRFHENVVWTMRGNYLAVPMDCPQRDERLGWTGDTQLFAPTAAFLFDTEAFFLSWLRDLALEQRENDGIVPLFAPNVVPGFASRGPIAAWGDAIAIIPELLAERTGDSSLLAEFLPAMTSWLDRVQDALDEDGLWTAGRQLGDWLDPNAPPNAPARGRTDSEIVATAYFVHTSRLVAGIAAELGDDALAERLAAASERSRRSYVDSYVSPGGRMMCDTQSAYAITLAFDLVDDEALRERLGRRLASVVRRDGYHIATGLVGTSMIARALSSTGHADAASRLLFQTEAPSWLFPVTVGATTVWERWDGLRPDGTLNPGAMVSFNHVALGSVAAWLHEDVVGLRAAEPGYRRSRIEPLILDGLDHAEAAHLTPYGRLRARWERQQDEVTLTVEVPPNTTAEVLLPDGRTFDVLSGEHEWSFADSPRATHPPLTLDSSMAELADDPDAYRGFYRALATSPNTFVARAVRSNAQYRETLSIRDALVFCDEATLAAVEVALRGGDG
ncbi:family 78 glycoside hydrolase catalytic domain [Microbacterium suwonense]|uniref:family 78 glycoside hydrolase catalytic domain n=1 Tax=Microbacterium suwonense TaxID=683047 RepID=UPI00361A909C